MLRSRCHRFWLSVLCLLSMGTPALGQWETQEILLRPGWNAVFLEVQPEPNETDVVFRDLPIESAWTWNGRFSSVQFVQDASTLLPEQPEWLSYFLPGDFPPEAFPPGATDPFPTDLFMLRGGQAYLIKLRGGNPVTWRITGRPVARPLEWVPDSFNLVGFPVDPANPPTFQAHLAPSAAHAGAPLFRLGASGEWEGIAATETIQAGEAYWIFCEGSSTYPGPLRATTEQAGGVDFGRVLAEQVIRVENATNAIKQVTFASEGSVSPPSAALPPLAGPVPLSYWDGATLRWVDLAGSLTRSVNPGEELALRFGVRRADMASAAEEALHQSLLRITDAEGTQLTLPVVARGMNSSGPAAFSSGGPLRLAQGETPTDPRAGLWVGIASLDRVSWATDPVVANRTVPTPTASEFQIRLIVHVDQGGQARLLQRVTLMWKEGTQKPDPADPSKIVVDEPGRFALVTRDDLISQFLGASIRDNEQVGRRISSAAFGFSDPLPLNGSFDGTLQSGAITLAYDDPLNPFKHRFHPDHDNLDFEFAATLPEGDESYTIVRNLELEFTANDPTIPEANRDGLQPPGWGDTQVGGLYRETLTGLHREVLHVGGTFRLHHASRVPVLNDGL